MALIPLFLDYLGDPNSRPSRLADQHFGHGLTHEDLSGPLYIPGEYRAIHHSPYYRPWRHDASSPCQDVGSTVHLGKDAFKVDLDVQHFKPQEISVKVTDKNEIIVEGKHEEKQDEHGMISRHFVRKYFLPKAYNVEALHSKLSSDGVLSIAAPKIENTLDGAHRKIPIENTGKPTRSGESKTAAKKLE